MLERATYLHTTARNVTTFNCGNIGAHYYKIIKKYINFVRTILLTDSAIRQTPITVRGPFCSG